MTQLSSPAAITLEHVSVTYPYVSEPALDDITAVIPRGSVTMVIGPNGAGKSTLVKAILGMIPFQGKITFAGGQVLTQLHHHIGYLPQRFQLSTTAPLTVTEFLELALVSCHHTRLEQQQMITEVLKKVGFEHSGDSLILELSGGQLQRVLLARALVHQPAILVLDEPEAGIDASGEDSLFDVLRQLTLENMTIVMVSHELSLVSKYADQVLCINKKLVCGGPADETLTSATFQSLYPDGMQPYSHQQHHHK